MNRDNSLVVFTRDLRIHDNRILNWAIENYQWVACLFVFDPNLTNSATSSANRIHYLCESLEDLRSSLNSLGGKLFVRYGKWQDQIEQFVQDTAPASIAWAKDSSQFGQNRDAKLIQYCKNNGIEAFCENSHNIVDPTSIWPAASNEPREFKVFTPYYNKWLNCDFGLPVKAPSKISTSHVMNGLDEGAIENPRKILSEFISPNREIGGETLARKKLNTWVKNHLEFYLVNHDDLAADRTSRISTALHFGTLSAREVAVKLKDKKGSDAFIRQLCWRDFYHQILHYNPRVSKNDYVDRQDKWNDSQEHFELWCQGQTGYPLVDAAMRQLQLEGFMHNRARMVVASFLTKDLYINWKHGADWFMKWLSDGDIANNYLNWQWTAGTGTDTNPHRIFNPIRQSERFDPDGIYIKRYVPELEKVSVKDIHFPHHLRGTLEGHELLNDYPLPIVNHSEAIAQYKLARQKK